MVTISLLVLLLLSFWVGLYLLMKQQGRILLRLDQLAQEQPGVDQARSAQARVGTLFPPFILNDLTGKMVSLEDFGGQQVLLVYWNPDCGFCDLIAPELTNLDAVFKKHNLQLLLLASGGAPSNRKLADEHGLKCPVLLLKDGEKPDYFEMLGTPAAYLVDGQGRVAKPVAVGFDEVLALAREAVSTRQAVDQTVKEKSKRSHLPNERPLSDSRIQRDGLSAGTPAPTFRLPDVYDRMVSLEDYRGRQVLLVFSDPHCQPCDELAPRLAGLHREHGDSRLALILISRGDVEENRRKVKQFGIKFPVVVQEKWKISKEYGIFMTPVAFLVGEGGVIARDVVIGPDAILALAQEELTRTYLTLVTSSGKDGNAPRGTD